MNKSTLTFLAAASLAGVLPAAAQDYPNRPVKIVTGYAAGGASDILTSGAKRPLVAPDVPTVAESGVPGFAVSSWYGVFAPAGTPKPVLDRLAAGIARAVELPDVQVKLMELGSDPYILTAAAFAQLIRRDQDMWQKLIRERNIKVEF